MTHEYIVRMPSDMPYEIKAELNAWYVEDGPIVRCRECKYMLHYHAEESKDRKDSYWCMLADWKCGVQLYRDSGYCAWGERREP